MEDNIAVLLRLSLLEGILSKDSIKQLRLTSRKLRDSLNQDFWRSIHVSEIIGIPQAATSLINLHLESIYDLRVSNDKQTAAFPNVKELSLVYDGQDETLMACLKLFPNLKILKPWAPSKIGIFSKGMSQEVSQFLSRHCPDLDTISLHSFTCLLKFRHLRRIRHVIVREEEDNEYTGFRISIFRAMPKQWKQTIETVEFDGMLKITRAKCVQVYNRLFTPDMGYASFRKLVLKCDRVNAGAVLNVRNGAVTDYFKFGSAPEGTKFEYITYDVFSDGLFDKDEEDDFAQFEDSECTIS